MLLVSLEDGMGSQMASLCPGRITSVPLSGSYNVCLERVSSIVGMQKLHVPSTGRRCGLLPYYESHVALVEICGRRKHQKHLVAPRVENLKL